jgi:tetratricopeptide (TPR) repeat protein
MKRACIVEQVPSVMGRFVNDADAVSAFMSYSRFDDEHDEHALTRLRSDLSQEVQAQTGLAFNIFQDTEDLGIGEDWEERITETAKTADFLIPMISPTFLQREWCRKEVLLFAEREKRQHQSNLILPIYYIRSDALDEKNRRHEDEVITVLQAANWFDWTEVRMARPDSEKRRRKLAGLALKVSEAIKRSRDKSRPERAEEAKALFNAALDARDRDPKDAAILFTQLLTRYRDGPTVYFLQAIIQKAWAVGRLGRIDLAVESLDWAIDQWSSMLPMDDPEWNSIYQAHLQMARLNREELLRLAAEGRPVPWDDHSQAADESSESLTAMPSDEPSEVADDPSEFARDLPSWLQLHNHEE